MAGVDQLSRSGRVRQCGHGGSDRVVIVKVDVYTDRGASVALLFTHGVKAREAPIAGVKRGSLHEQWVGGSSVSRPRLRRTISSSSDKTRPHVNLKSVLFCCCYYNLSFLNHNVYRSNLKCLVCPFNIYSKAC
jgi:hypothetical protein